MKKRLFLNLGLLCLISIAFTSCDNTNISNETSSSQQEDNYECITISEAINIAKQAGETLTTERYFVKGVIDSVKDATYGSMTITDNTGSLYVYGTYDSEGFLRYGELEDKPVVGDTVTLSVDLHTFNNEAEARSGWIMDFVKSDTEYESVSIADAREKVEGSNLQVSGTVAAITYANGCIPNGFYLVDNTSSIYVYGKDVVAGVEVGNNVTVTGNKTWYVLDTEKAAAETWSYKGSCQLQKAVVISNDKQVNDFPTSWIETTTVKELIETPVSENITNKIYKVNAFIKKSVGTGFINYYINDLDGTTGVYTYTQANGADFTWLDEYDNKLCELYLTAINAKASASDCFFRLIPIKITKDDVVFNQADGAKFALQYYVKDLFDSSYNSNPALALPLKANNELISLGDVTFEYSSSNTSVVNFEVLEDKVVMNTNEQGTATVTINATYGQYNASISLDISVEESIEVDSVKVIDAINSADETEVVVRGIAGPSLVNQVGFYLIDETGVIAVRCNSDVMESIKIGNDVVIKGTKTHVKPEGVIGQAAIDNSTCVANYFGEHEYSTSTFDYSKSLSDICNYDVTETDYTTSVFVIDAYIYVKEAAYSSTISLQNPTDSNEYISLYCSSANQYSWLQAYKGQVVKVEVALCNWNKKSYYRGCVLAVIKEDGSKELNTLNYK